jgi:hypothetical protein
MDCSIKLAGSQGVDFKMVLGIHKLQNVRHKLFIQHAIMGAYFLNRWTGYPVTGAIGRRGDALLETGVIFRTNAIEWT